MPLGRYRITSPTIAVIIEDGRHVAHMVPSGAIISVDGVSFDKDRLVDVTWDNKKAMMFTQDLRSRSLPMDQTVL
jgi:hypothetical protein